MDERFIDKEKTPWYTAIWRRIALYVNTLIGKGEKKDSAAESSRMRKALMLKALYIFVAFVFAGCPLFYGTHPLALALVCAVGGNLAVFAFAGAAIGALFAKGSILVQIICITLALAGRLLLRYAPGGKGIFKEPIIVRVALATALSFVLALYDLIASGFSYGSLYALIFTIAFVPVCCALFAYALDREALPVVRDLGHCMLLFFVIYALNNVGILGMSLGVIASVFVVLSVAIKSGALRASVTGALCGLACGVTYAPIIALLGLVSGIFSNTNILFAISSGVGASLALAVYLQGYLAIFTYIGDALLASLLFLPLFKSGLVPSFTFFESAQNMPQGSAEKEKRQYEKSRLSSLSSAFDELSDELLEMSERQKKPTEREYFELCEDVSAHRCFNCINNERCQEKHPGAIDSVTKIVAHALSQGGAFDAEALPDSFKKTCPYYEELILDINSASADMTENALKKDKTELIALDYEAMSELLGLAAVEGEDELSQDSALAGKCMKVFRSLGISAMGFSAHGTRVKKVTVTGITIGTLSSSGKEIKESLEAEFGFPLEEAHFDFCGEYVTMTISSRPKIFTDGCYVTRCKKGEDCCGDAVKIFEGINETCCAVICDGMGSGKMASVTAKVSSVFLEKMIGGGNKKGVVLKMLSNFIRSKSEECTCTVDLLEIDRYTSEAVFTKCGAAASFVLREDKLFKIDARSLPIGVTRIIDPDEKRIALEKGDIIVMTSDGIAASFEDALWLPELIAVSADKPCKEIADEIFSRAENEGLCDDASVIVMKIGEI